MKWLLCVLIPVFLQSASFSPEEEGERRVRAHLLIEDPQSALQEAQQLAVQFPDSLSVEKVLVEALAANGLEEPALNLLHKLTANHPDLLYDRHILEELSWGILK